MENKYREDLGPKGEEILDYLEDWFDNKETDKIEKEFPGKGQVAKEMECSTQTVGKTIKKLALKNYGPVREFMEEKYSRRKSIAAEAARAAGDYALANKILRSSNKEKKKEGVEKAFRKYL